MTNREEALAGICSDCGCAIKPLSEEEIKEIEEDLGLDETDDFSNCCDDCLQVLKDHWAQY